MTEPACRICYDDDSAGPLISPCDCRGSVQYIHRQCLYEWLVVDGRDHCELCGSVYMFYDLILEPVYEPRDFRVIRLSTRPHLLFILQLLTYMLYLLFQYQQPDNLDHRPVQAGLISIGRAMPTMLIGLACLQARVLVPAIWILNDKTRYLRYLLTKPPGFRLSIPFFFAVILGSFLLTFYWPVVGACVYVHYISYLYDAHCQIVNAINRDAITVYYSA